MKTLHMLETMLRLKGTPLWFVLFSIALGLTAGHIASTRKDQWLMGGWYVIGIVVGLCLKRQNPKIKWN